MLNISTHINCISNVLMYRCDNILNYTSVLYLAAVSVLISILHVFMCALILVKFLVYTYHVLLFQNLSFLLVRTVLVSHIYVSTWISGLSLLLFHSFFFFFNNLKFIV